jgi:hypothetical protein
MSQFFAAYDDVSIYATGTTEIEAVENARREVQDADAEFQTAPISAAFAAYIEAEGWDSWGRRFALVGGYLVDTTQAHDDAEFVRCDSDTGDGGWSLHAPGSEDEGIATGDAPALVSGTGEITREDYDTARAVLASPGFRRRGMISTLLAASGLSAAEFARTVVGRDERTVRRWLAGEPIPESVAAWLSRASVESTSRTVTIRVTR